MYKISIVTAVLNSHEVVRRQILHYKQMDLPNDIEIIFVDDGSKPPLSLFKRAENTEYELNNFHIYPTNDFREWTQPAARNYGVSKAKGEYIICTDIDHILLRDLIDTVYSGQWDVVRFRREFGILNECGYFSQDVEVLQTYGFPVDRLEVRGLKLTAHTNSFAMKKEIYDRLGGVSEKHVGSGKHPNREERPLKRGYKRLAEKGEITMSADNERPIIYMFPNGRFCGDKDYNPFGLFHELKRMTR